LALSVDVSVQRPPHDVSLPLHPAGGLIMYVPESRDDGGGVVCASGVPELYVGAPLSCTIGA
jgi:hypothetical protein